MCAMPDVECPRWPVHLHSRSASCLHGQAPRRGSSDSRGATRGPSEHRRNEGLSTFNHGSIHSRKSRATSLFTSASLVAPPDRRPAKDASTSRPKDSSATSMTRCESHVECLFRPSTPERTELQCSTLKEAPPRACLETANIRPKAQTTEP